MDLKDFISQSLQEILRGVDEAQKTGGGENIAANMAGIQGGGNLINGGKHGLFTRVDFDVAVTAESSGSGGANLKVFGVGFEGGGEHTTGRANRLTFSVPVRLPRGDQEVDRKLKADLRAATEQVTVNTTRNSVGRRR